MNREAALVLSSSVPAVKEYSMTSRPSDKPRQKLISDSI